MHVACPSCGATIPEDASGCRYCSVQSERNSEVEEWSEETATGWGVDSFSLMVALAATAWPVHAALLVWVPPYLVPHSMMQLDIRFAAAGVCGLLVALLWRPRSTRGLLVLLVFAFHSMAFVQSSSWRSGDLGLSSSVAVLGLQVGMVAAGGCLVAFGLRRLAGALLSSAASATSMPEQ
jgi:hypothetical protein